VTKTKKILKGSTDQIPNEHKKEREMRFMIYLKRKYSLDGGGEGGG
jgi:hypothetical protein